MRLLQFSKGAWGASDSVEPDEARELAWGPTHVWIRLEGLDQQKLENLAATFNLHPLAIEDVRNHRQRPKVEDYPELTFVVVRVPRLADDGMHWLTLGLFLGPDFLITACTDPVLELDAVEKRLLNARPNARTSSIDHVFYQVLDAVVDAYFPVMDDLEDRIEALEEGVLDGADREELERIQGIKRLVSRTRKTIVPMREATAMLERGDHPHIREETRLYLRDVADHMARLAERLEHVREMAVLTQETYNATLANQTNRVVKALTAVTLFTTIPMLIGTLLGMNLDNVPHQWSFWHVSLASMLVIIPLYIVARRLDWM
ncbi:MAG TPA: magnesium transporter CorA family protein [Candidatus Thermoplasmatota archaeon]|nr:magnesium transporter CorA family protein [Candidatus Thermoplasmatota archaeon]